MLADFMKITKVNLFLSPTKKKCSIYDFDIPYDTYEPYDDCIKKKKN